MIEDDPQQSPDTQPDDPGHEEGDGGIGEDTGGSEPGDNSDDDSQRDVPASVARTRRRFITTLGMATVLASAIASPAVSAIKPPYKNCTMFNKKYPHGVGKVGARDHTSGKPVTTFRRSNRLYAIAMQNNRGLDRDKDGIACESA